MEHVKRKRQWNLIIPRIITRVFLYILLIFCAVAFMFPFYDMVIGSFMDDNDLFSSHPNFWPQDGFDLDAYRDLFAIYNFWRPLFNSFYMSTVRTVGTLFLCSLAGFTFAKRHFPGRDKLFFIMLATMMLPYQATIIPWYLLMVKVLKWTDTYWPFWIPAWATAFGIFMMRQYVASSVPDELLDAAAIDGCSVFGTFTRVVLPIIMPGLSVLAILTFIQSWNEFLGPLLILGDPDKYTAPLALVAFRGSQRVAPRYAMLFAGSTLSTLPLLIVFFVFQRQLISGIMSGAIKGGG
jgi:ABC-type glycerol-3-phosphate transport system permease component